MRDAHGLLVLLLVVAALPSCRRPIPTAPDRETIAQTVAAFHDALAKGDGAGAMHLLADTAEVLEMGSRETRAEYERSHLAADIAFAKAVPTTHTAMVVRQEGEVAWITSTSKSVGEFNGRQIDSAGTELMVLHKTADGWRIRAIHWSSQPTPK